MDIHALNKSVIEEFRANSGKVGGQFENVPLLLLHTIGARTGEPRVNPLAYFPEGDDIVVIASYAGAPNNPPWYYNLVRNPEVEVEMGTERLKARAEVMSEPARTEMYDKIAAALPTFAEYQSKTTRVIPVVLLHPAG